MRCEVNGKMMAPKDRYSWVAWWMNTYNYGRGDVLDRYLVEEYVEATGAAFAPMPYGADVCRMLGRDLSAMHRLGYLTRARFGLQGMLTGFQSGSMDTRSPPPA